MQSIIEKRLEELVPDSEDTLFKAVRYSLFSKGKRLRPLLTLATTKAFGKDPMLAIDVACAIEMIHTYSLIHDDLPCMDDDDLRRNQPTLHKVFGEAAALLAGDYLLTYAFETVANARLPADTNLQIIKILSQRSSSSGLIGGQMLDIESVGKSLPLETLNKMHNGKTASLFIAALECASLAAGICPSPLLKQIGHELGLAYQYKNDLLDASLKTSELGKNPGGDFLKKKPTALSLFCKDDLKEKISLLTNEILININKIFPDKTDKEITHIIKNQILFI